MRTLVTSFAFDKGTELDSAFSRSTVTAYQAAAWAGRDGVAEAGLFGNTLVNAEVTGDGGRSTPIDLALFGVDADRWLAPEAAEGSGLGTDPDGIVVSPRQPVVAAALDGMVRAVSRTIEEGASLDEVWATVRRMVEPFLTAHAG